MTIKEFIKKYEAMKENEKESAIEALITTKYVSYETKVNDCLRIVDVTYYYKDPQTEKKSLHISSSTAFILYIMNLVNRYTALDVDFSHMVQEYDALNETDILSPIVMAIPEREQKEFKMILDMCQDDCLQNEYQVGAYISNKIDSVSKTLGVALSPILDKFVDQLQNLDEDKVMGFVKQLEKSKIFKALKK